MERIVEKVVERRYGVTIIALLLLSIALVNTSCFAGSDVVHAEAVDWVWGFEELRSGATRVWLRHDNIAGYCTSDPALASIAKEANGDKVLIAFKSMKYADDENWNSSGCNRLSTGTESSTPIFKITDIRVLEAGGN